MIYDLRFYAHKSSYELCRRMELFPADARRIVALVETHLDVFEVVFPEQICVLHGIADSKFDSNVLRAIFLISSNSTSSGAI